MVANPAGLYRVGMMETFAGPDVLADLGMTAVLPGAGGVAAIWTAWLVLPTFASGWILAKAKAP